MKESEIRKLFAVIQSTYSDRSFGPENSFKIELWRDLLKDTPFELAQANLRAYILDPSNKFPPHPGVLAAADEQKSYHDQLRISGQLALMQHDQINAVPPSVEQRRKVRETFARLRS
ncbi:replicative helicase loader/inhibitor [Paenibacillus tyrfis]|uniref:replicative helicase loader/inhibitor n=1 Tax=Paenibacillus tyrfis TaxID=1501230 RepID=UPI000B58DB93|nr:replicative helicase loader/inhibitor [Paenibacillus tyrfis]